MHNGRQASGRQKLLQRAHHLLPLTCGNLGFARSVRRHEEYALLRHHLQDRALNPVAMLDRIHPRIRRDPRGLLVRRVGAQFEDDLNTLPMGAYTTVDMRISRQVSKWVTASADRGVGERSPSSTRTIRPRGESASWAQRT